MSEYSKINALTIEERVMFLEQKLGIVEYEVMGLAQIVKAYRSSLKNIYIALSCIGFSILWLSGCIWWAFS